MSNELARSKRLLADIQRQKLRDAIIDVLSELQGHGRGFDADLLDGLHAADILGKMRGGGSAGGGSTVIQSKKLLFGFWSMTFLSGGAANHESLNYPQGFTDVHTAETPIGAGKFTKIIVNVANNDHNGQTVLELKVNAEIKATITIPAGQTGKFTETWDVETAEGDLVCVNVNCSASTSGGDLRLMPLFVFEVA